MTKSHDVAVILGAATEAVGVPSRALLRRVAHGAGLFHAGRVRVLLMTGGVVRHPPAEALLMRDAALAAGVPPEAVWIETQSQNTLENALFCRPLLEQAGFRRVLVVTDRSHLPRALYTFRRLGLAADGEAVPRPRWTGRQFAFLLREAAAFAVYLWRVERLRRQRSERLRRQR